MKRVRPNSSSINGRMAGIIADVKEVIGRRGPDFDVDHFHGKVDDLAREWAVEPQVRDLLHKQLDTLIKENLEQFKKDEGRRRAQRRLD